MKNYPQTLIRTKAIFAAAAIAAAPISFSGTASAQTSKTDMSVKIDMAHLDTSSEAGAKILYRKIKNAAAKICGESDSRMLFRIERKIKACKMETVEKAVYKADLPMLVAVHTGKPAVNTRLFAKNETEIETKKTP